MVARGFAEPNAWILTGLGGASLMNNCRPSVLVIFAIWAFAAIAHTASVARMMLAATAVRFTIVPLGKAKLTIKRLSCSGRSDLIGATRLAKPCLKRANCLLPDTLLALGEIIATPPAGRG